jgi:hypothetical protein
LLGNIALLSDETNLVRKLIGNDDVHFMEFYLNWILAIGDYLKDLIES